MADTTRQVETRWTATDAGYTATIGRIGSAFGGVARKTDELRSRFGDFRREIGFSTLGMLGIGAGIGAWVEKAREANAEFGQTQKGIAGILSGSLQFAKGTTEIERYNRSLVLSRGITEKLEETASRFNTGFADAAGTYRSVTVAAGNLGLSQQQVMSLTEQAIATAKRFGASGEQAATGIARALMTGTVRGFDPFDIKLRQVLGNMHKLNQVQRFDHIQRALAGSMQVADAMSTGIGASINRAQMAVTGVFREATGPLFKQIATSLEGWAKHIRDLRENGRPLVQDFAGKLVDAFKILRDVSGFIKDHWMVIGATFAGIKAGGLAAQLGGALSGAGAALGAGGLGGGALFGVGRGLAGAGGLLGTLGALAPALGGIVTAAGLAGIALHGVYEEWQGRKKQAADLGGFFDEMGKVAGTQQYLQKHNAGLTPEQIDAGKAYAAAHAAAAQEILKSKGLWENNAIAMQKFGGVMDAMSDDVRDAFAKKLGLSGLGSVSSGMLGSAAAEVLTRNTLAAARATEGATSDKNVKFAKQVNNFFGGIHITQKFDDPSDNIFVRFQDDLHREVGSRTQALGADPQGD